MGVLRNVRHEKFAQGIFKGLPASTAYTNAGYKFSEPHASRLARDGKVRARVEELQGRVAQKVEISVERVLAELAKVGFTDMTHYMTIREDGQAVLDFSKIPPGGTAAIGSIEQEVIMVGDPNDAMPIQKTKFKLHDKLKALEMIGKHLKMFVDRQTLR